MRAASRARRPRRGPSPSTAPALRADRVDLRRNRTSISAATRGSKRSIELPFFSLQTSELGKLLLVLSLAAFAIDQGRRLGERQRTLRLLRSGSFPRCSCSLQPDLGTAAVYGAITLAILFVSGTLDALCAHRRARPGAPSTLILVVAPAVGHPSSRAISRNG